MRGHHRGAGFSLVEIAVLVTIVSLAVPPIVSLLGQTLIDSTKANRTAQATQLARSMMEEILSKEYEDPQAPSGSFGTEESSRIDYDDVDDYDGYTQSPPTDCRGSAFAAYAGFRVRVTVNNVMGDDPGGAAAPDGSTSYKRIVVRVSWNDGERVVRLDGLSTSYNHDLDRPPVELTFLSRLSTSYYHLKFRVQNTGDSGVYLTNLIPTWSSPTAYFEQIRVRVIGYLNYDTVWDYRYSNYVRMESGGNAMFNVGDVVYVPAGRTAEIEIRWFSRRRTGWWGGARDVRNTPFTMEIWAGPDHCTPFTIPAL